MINQKILNLMMILETPKIHKMMFLKIQMTLTMKCTMIIMISIRESLGLVQEIKN